MRMCIQNLIEFFPIIRILSNHSQDIEPKPNSDIKQGLYNSVANLQNMTLYISNGDLVNDNVNTKFGHNPCIRS